MRRLSYVISVMAVAAAAVAASPAWAQQTDPAQDDAAISPAEPDFTLAALPTSLRLPAGKLDFHLTHRFTQPVSSGGAGNFFSSFFTFDSSAIVGLELRYGIAPGTQLAVQRTSDRTIAFQLESQLAGQGAHGPMTIDLLASSEGGNNFRTNYAKSIGAVISRRAGAIAAVYVEPIATFDANTGQPTAPAPGTADRVLMIGLGARLRLGAHSTSYVVAEYVPRVAGVAPGADHASIGIEKRVGGHVFQLNVSDSFASTLGQIARGGLSSHDWYLGFNLSRKFY